MSNTIFLLLKATFKYKKDNYARKLSINGHYLVEVGTTNRPQLLDSHPLFIWVCVAQSLVSV